MAVLPPNLRRALAAAPPSRDPSLRDIKHVVLLMQENRSFEHYFGTMPGVIGFSDPDALVLPPGRNVFHQPSEHHPDGYLLPFHLDSRTTSAQRIPSTGHGWEVLHRGLERRQDGQLADRALPARRQQGERPALDGLLRGGGYPLPPRARRSLHDLRPLSQLDDGLDRAQPALLGNRHDRSPRPEHRADSEQRGDRRAPGAPMPRTSPRRGSAGAATMCPTA
jgi:hypothetical protein